MSQFQVEDSYRECLEKIRSLAIASAGHFHSSRWTSQLYGWFIYFTLPELDVVDILGSHLKEKITIEQ